MFGSAEPVHPQTGDESPQLSRGFVAVVLFLEVAREEVT